MSDEWRDSFFVPPPCGKQHDPALTEKQFQKACGFTVEFMPTGESPERWIPIKEQCRICGIDRPHTSPPTESRYPSCG